MDLNADETKTGFMLVQCVHYNKLHIIKLLIDKGASMDSSSTFNDTALHAAAEVGRDDIVSFLLDRGANINCSDKAGWSPLMFAAEKGHTRIACMLIDAGADVNHALDGGITPLHIAVDEPQITSMLLEKRANEDAIAEGT